MKRIKFAHKLFVIATNLIFLLIVNSLSQATIIPSTLEYMTGFSGLIVTGTVMNKTSYWKEKNIYTDVTVQVDNLIKDDKGIKPETVTVSVIGGTVGDMTQRVDESPVFKVGERLMLFLVKKTRVDKYQPFALGYGVFRIVKEDGIDYVNGQMFNYDQMINLNTMQPLKNTTLKGRQPLNSFTEKIKAFIGETN